MKHFTIVTNKAVLRVRALNVQRLTQALHEVGISFIGLHEDDE